MIFPIKPQNSRLIVKPNKREEQKSVGGIIKGHSDADLEEGMVVAVAPEIAEKYDLGCLVSYPREAGVGQLVNGEPHLWLQDNVVWGIVLE